MQAMALVQQVKPAGSGDVPPIPTDHPRLRIGLFAATRRQPRALVEAFEEIAHSDYAEIVLLAVNNRNEDEVPWLWRIYRHLDRWIFSTAPRSAEMVDLVSRLKAIHSLNLPGNISGSTVVNIWQAKIAALRLDVAFVLGDLESKTLESVARFGVWRFQFGEERELHNGLEGFREVADGQAMTTIRLIAALAADGEQLLYESRSRTAPFSATRNQEKLLRRAAKLPGRVLKELHRSTAAVLPQAPGRALPGPDRAPAADLKMMPSLINIGGRIVLRCLQKLFYVEQWFIAYSFSNDDGETPAPGRSSCLMPPTDRFWADPFPLLHDGRHYIFFEELVFAEGKAHISVIEVDHNGPCSRPQRVLERPYHLSYPFLVEEEGQLFMVPETGANGTVELYRCLHFPDRWIFEKELLKVPGCVDATLHYADEKWWMFVNLGDAGDGDYDEMHIYHADNLCGEWQAHRLNPVKSDVRNARPAGRLFERNGALYRPAQIGVPLYGSGISINRILKLSTEEFLEQEVGRILPQRTGNFLGVHTLNQAGKLSVVDGFVRRTRLGATAQPQKAFEPEYLVPEFTQAMG